jgi:hypothetical protein
MSTTATRGQLFETVVGQALGELADAVPFTPDDLPGYAAALFDHLIAHPKLMRLGTWKQLEHPEVVDAQVDAYRAKLEAIGHAQRAGHLSSALDPVDLLILVLALASAWFAASPALHSLAAQDPTSPERLADHRAAGAAAVRALTTAAVPQAAAPDGRRDHGRCRAHQEARDQAWPAWVAAPRKRRRGASGWLLRPLPVVLPGAVGGATPRRGLSSR